MTEFSPPSSVITPENITDEGMKLQPNETISVLELGDEREAVGLGETSFVAGGIQIQGRPSLVVRMGGEQDHTDAVVLDVRSQPEVPSDLKHPLHKVGFDRDAEVQMAGDYILLVPAKDQSTFQMRALVPGKSWVIGRGKNNVGYGILAPTVSRDHCAVTLEEDGSLQVENHNPTNTTTIYRPESVISTTEVGAKTEVTPKIAAEMLSYADVLSGPERDRAIAITEHSESGKKYTKALVEMFKQYGADLIADVSRDMMAKCQDTLRSLGIDSSNFGRSISWALWDIAKQKYLYEHPEQSSPEYRSFKHSVPLANPLENSPEGERKRDEIIDRHVGWEFDEALSSGRTRLESLPRIVREQIEPVINQGQRNESGQLRSFELALLGRRIRRYFGLSTPI